MLVKILHHKSHVIQLNHLLERQAAGPVAEVMCLVPRPTDNQPIWHELRLCSHHTGYLSCIVSATAARGGTSRLHTSNIVTPRLAATGFGALDLQSSLLNIFFCLSRFQLSLPLIYFRDRPHRCSYCSKVWHKTYRISDALLSRLAGPNLAPLQKSRR